MAECVCGCFYPNETFGCLVSLFPTCSLRIWSNTSFFPIHLSFFFCLLIFSFRHLYRFLKCYHLFDEQHLDRKNLGSHFSYAVNSFLNLSVFSDSLVVGFPFLQKCAKNALVLIVKWSKSCSVMSSSLRPHGLYSPCNLLGQNTGGGSLSLLQGIFPTQGSNPGLPHCRWILCQLSHREAHGGLNYQNWI